MIQHPFAAARYAQAANNMEKLLEAFSSGDLETFINITEQEAFTLHGMMMSSMPGFVLMEPNTLNIINAVRSYRSESGVPLYPQQYETQVQDFINHELLKWCVDSTLINDKMGSGPERISRK